MPQVRMVGWQVGLRKVSVTMLLQKHAFLGLRKAKDCTDCLLDNETVILDIEDDATAQELARELREVEAIVQVVP